MKKQIQKKAIKSKEGGELIGLLIFAVLFFLAFIPVFFDYRSVSTVGRVFMIIGSSVYFILLCLIIIAIEKTREKDNEGKKSSMLKARITYIVILSFSVYTTLSYFNRSIWGSLGIVLAGAFVIFILFGIYNELNKINHILNYENIIRLILAVGIFFVYLWSMKSFFDDYIADIFIKIGIGILYLVFISVFINLALFKPSKDSAKKHRLVSIIFSIIFSLAVLLTFPYYVQWCGLSDKPFETFVAVYAAIVGGGLTLVGVAWTFKKSDADRKIEKEESVRPFIGIINDMNHNLIVAANQNQIQFCSSQGTEYYRMRQCNLINSDKSVFVIDKIQLGEKFYYPDSNFMIGKQFAFQIVVMEEEDKFFDTDTMILYLTDENYKQRKYLLTKTNGLNGFTKIELLTDDK